MRQTDNLLVLTLGNTIVRMARSMRTIRGSKIFERGITGNVDARKLDSVKFFFVPHLTLHELLAVREDCTGPVPSGRPK